MRTSQSSWFTPAIHFIIWGLLLGIPSIIFWKTRFEGLSHHFFIVTSLYHIGIFYFIAYFLYPKLLNKKWWWLFVLSIVALLVLSCLVKLYYVQTDPEFIPNDINRRVIFFGLIPFIIAAIIFRLVNDRIRFEKLQKEAMAERLDAELKYLRSQVSPHFLFNMMTNMVALARQKSDQLEPSLIRLSELLRYMLYDSEEGKILLSDETEQLKNYVALQQLRFGDDVELDFKIENNCSDCAIEPLLLVPFIENAFKHGIGMVTHPYIHIELAASQKKLNFTVTNNFNPANISKDKSSGIGLANVKNRLVILYPQKHDLSIKEKDGIFSVLLKLDLT